MPRRKMMLQPRSSKQKSRSGNTLHGHLETVGDKQCKYEEALATARSNVLYQRTHCGANGAERKNTTLTASAKDKLTKGKKPRFWQTCIKRQEK